MNYPDPTGRGIEPNLNNAGSYLFRGFAGMRYFSSSSWRRRSGGLVVFC